MTEFLPWYQSGSDLVRCSTCGAVVISADTVTHLKWHTSNEG